MEICPLGAELHHEDRWTETCRSEQSVFAILRRCLKTMRYVSDVSLTGTESIALDVWITQ